MVPCGGTRPEVIGVYRHTVNAPGNSHQWAAACNIMYWLPPHGISNGVAARAWAILADLTEKQTYPALFALADADIATCAAAVAITKLEPDSRTVGWRLWVDTAHYTDAQDVLMGLLR